MDINTNRRWRFRQYSLLPHFLLPSPYLFYSLPLTPQQSSKRCLLFTLPAVSPPSLPVQEGFRATSRIVVSSAYVHHHDLPSLSFLTRFYYSTTPSSNPPCSATKLFPLLPPSRLLLPLATMAPEFCPETMTDSSLSLAPARSTLLNRPSLTLNSSSPRFLNGATSSLS